MRRQAPCCRFREGSEGKHCGWTVRRPAGSGQHCTTCMCLPLKRLERRSMCLQGTWSILLATRCQTDRSMSPSGTQCKQTAMKPLRTGSTFLQGNSGRPHCWLPRTLETMCRADTPCTQRLNPSLLSHPTCRPGMPGMNSASGMPLGSSMCPRDISNKLLRLLHRAHCSKCQDDTECTQSHQRRSMCPVSTRHKPCFQTLGTPCPGDKLKPS
mmetsp:Transcript_74416/g.187513  ORF Transcript_74416/g.187513 Transcript_74416/m.187513 type:complete len:212 (+) Transcript_74416:1160-1795(+)